MKETTPIQLKSMMDSGESFYLLDVREEDEREICSIGGTLIPLSSFEENFQKVPQDQKVIVYCKMGGRSAQAVDFLTQNGYSEVYNLVGGIIEWINQVDDSLQKY